MKQWMQIGLVAFATATLGACAGDRQPGMEGTAGTAGTSGATAMSSGDRDFIEDTIADGEAEVELGRLAQQRATSADVREFGGMMVRDHQKAGEQLKQIARSNKLTAPPHADEEHTELRDRLSKMSGAEFDRAYINAMVDDHQKAVNELEDKAEADNDTELKRWAAQTLPAVRQHLERAKQIQQNLGR